MPATDREPAKVTFDQLDAHNGEFLPERTVLSGAGAPGTQGISGSPASGTSNPLGILTSLVPGGSSLGSVGSPG